MYRTLGFTFLSLLLFGGTADAQLPEIPDELTTAIPLDPSVTIGTLANGFRYYIQQNEKPENRVQMRLVVNAGSVLEDEDQLGLAHFVEHMAFNGTKHFKKNELVSYLQSVGVEFGADLNAYTSFDETVYMLPIPSDDPEVLDQGLRILRDWAGELTFDPEEIDKERGVVIEEWRLGQSAEQRMRDEALPLIFRDSRYAERLPIGAREILDHFDHESLKRFYRDWYRPDLMAVAVVGDIDVVRMQTRIIELFGNLPLSQSPRPRTEFPVPDHDELLVQVSSDPEASGTRASIYIKSDNPDEAQLGALRDRLITSLATSMLSQRLRDMTREADPPFAQAYTYFGSSWARSKSNLVSQAVLAEEGIERGFKALAREMERARRYGFIEAELERQKKKTMRSRQSAYEERDKTDSRRLVSRLANYFLEGKPNPGPAFHYAFAKKHMDGISLKEVNTALGNLLRQDNTVIWVQAPERDAHALPSEDEVRSWYTEVRKTGIEPYLEDEIADQVIDAIPDPVPVVKRKRHEKVGVTEIEFANGVVAFLMETDFKNDEVRISAYSPGGHSLVPDDLFYSAMYADNVINESGVGNFDAKSWDKFRAGKKAYIRPSISELEERLGGSAAPEDLELAFQLIYAHFTAPRSDQQALESSRAKILAMFETYVNNPMAWFYEQSGIFMASGHPRHIPYFPKEAHWDEVELEEIRSVWKDRFGDAGDFTFFIVGALEEEHAIELCARYLGNLPTQGREESGRDLGIRPPQGPQKERYYKGSDPKSMVQMLFTGGTEYKKETALKLSAMAELLDIKLIEIIREEKAGAYSVAARAYMTPDPYPHFRVTISFPCGPENVEELSAAVIEEINKIRAGEIEQEDLNKVKEQWLRTRQEKMEDNRFWLSQLRTSHQRGWPLAHILDYPLRVQSITVEDIQEMALQYVDPEACIELALFPEESKQ